MSLDSLLLSERIWKTEEGRPAETLDAGRNRGALQGSGGDHQGIPQRPGRGGEGDWRHEPGGGNATFSGRRVVIQELQEFKEGGLDLHQEDHPV